jgi:ribosome recycling factor
MALYKKEVLVRPNSTANFETAMQFAINWLDNTFQNVATNKDANGNFIDYFFADVYFVTGHATNSGQLWRIYSTPCATKYSMLPATTGRIEYMMIDPVGIDAKIQANTNSIASVNTVNSDLTLRVSALETAPTIVDAVVI